MLRQVSSLAAAALGSGIVRWLRGGGQAGRQSGSQASMRPLAPTQLTCNVAICAMRADSASKIAATKRLQEYPIDHQGPSRHEEVLPAKSCDHGRGGGMA